MYRIHAHAPIRRVRLARVRLDPCRVTGVGFGIDAEGRPVFYISDRWTLLRQSGALAAGHDVEVYVADHEAVAWRRA